MRGGPTPGAAAVAAPAYSVYFACITFPAARRGSASPLGGSLRSKLQGALPMQRLPLLLLVLLCTLFGCTEPQEKVIEPEPNPDAKPVALLVTPYAWRMGVVDNTQFVAYDDGTIIFRRRAGRRLYEYASVHNPQEVERLTGTEAQRKAFGNAPEYIHVTKAIHPPTTRVCLWLGEDSWCKSIFGLDQEGAKSAESVPEAVAEIVRPLARFSPSDAETLLPPQVVVIVLPYEQVMAWPNEPSPEEPAIWPDDWPDLDAPTTVQGLSEVYSDIYNLFVPSSDWERLRTFLNGLGERQAVLINGRK